MKKKKLINAVKYANANTVIKLAPANVAPLWHIVACLRKVLKVLL